VHTEAGRKIPADEVVWCTSAGEIDPCATHFFSKAWFHNSREGEVLAMCYVSVHNQIIFHDMASPCPLMCISAFFLDSQERQSGYRAAKQRSHLTRMGSSVSRRRWRARTHPGCLRQGTAVMFEGIPAQRPGCLRYVPVLLWRGTSGRGCLGGSLRSGCRRPLSWASSGPEIRPSAWRAREPWGWREHGSGVSRIG
jgi:hypothetical protein